MLSKLTTLAEDGIGVPQIMTIKYTLYTSTSRKCTVKAHRLEEEGDRSPTSVV